MLLSCRYACCLRCHHAHPLNTFMILSCLSSEYCLRYCHARPPACSAIPLRRPPNTVCDTATPVLRTPFRDTYALLRAFPRYRMPVLRTLAIPSCPSSEHPAILLRPSFEHCRDTVMPVLRTLSAIPSARPPTLSRYRYARLPSAPRYRYARFQRYRRRPAFYKAGDACFTAHPLILPAWKLVTFRPFGARSAGVNTLRFGRLRLSMPVQTAYLSSWSTPCGCALPARAWPAPPAAGCCFWYTHHFLG